MALECIVKVEQCLLMDWMQDVGEIDKVKMIPRVSHRIARRKVIWRCNYRDEEGGMCTYFTLGIEVSEQSKVSLDMPVDI